MLSTAREPKVLSAVFFAAALAVLLARRGVLLQAWWGTTAPPSPLPCSWKLEAPAYTIMPSESFMTACGLMLDPGTPS
jgi:hypothetical protein